MLPNHSPLVIAEQFGTLESLYPSRIDLGLGRAPGTDRMTAMALRRKLNGVEDDFPNNLNELINYFNSSSSDDKVRATPGEGLDIPIWLLGSSMFSAHLAAALGLPYAFASHFAPAYLDAAVKLYREKFQPSKRLREPYVMAVVNGAVANTNKEAKYLFTSIQLRALSMIRGNQTPLFPPINDINKVCSKLEKYALDQRLKYSFVGDPTTVKKDIEIFLNQIQINEIMVISHIYDHAARLRSYEILSSL
jgi:luciferase family oxidoreductase group 1